MRNRGNSAVGIVAWIVVGAIGGFVTNMIMGGSEGAIAGILVGIVGAVVGGYLASKILNVADVTGINLETLLVAASSGSVAVRIYRLLMGQRTARA